MSTPTFGQQANAPDMQMRGVQYVMLNQGMSYIGFTFRLCFYQITVVHMVFFRIEKNSYVINPIFFLENFVMQIHFKILYFLF